MFSASINQNEQTVDSTWTQKEIETLKVCIKHYGQDWTIISEMWLHPKTAAECQRQWEKSLKSFEDPVCAHKSLKQEPLLNQLKTQKDLSSHSKGQTISQQVSLISKERFFENHLDLESQLFPKSEEMGLFFQFENPIKTIEQFVSFMDELITNPTKNNK